MPLSADIMPSARACRCLFGMPDRDELQETLRKEKEELLLESNSEWNFDFEKEVPLTSPNSRYQWSKVSMFDNIPSAYELPHLVSSVKRKFDDLDDLVEERPSKVLVKDTAISCYNASENTDKTVDSERQPSTSSKSISQRQSKITDFFHIRKSSQDQEEKQ